jgi:hypothetical protein
MMINSNTRFFNKSLISFRLDFAKIETRIKNKDFSNWFENESSFSRKTIISTKFWYRNNKRLTRINLMIVNDLAIANDLMILKIAINELFWWSDI